MCGLRLLQKLHTKKKMPETFRSSSVHRVKWMTLPSVLFYMKADLGSRDLIVPLSVSSHKLLWLHKTVAFGLLWSIKYSYTVFTKDYYNVGPLHEAHVRDLAWQTDMYVSQNLSVPSGTEDLFFTLPLKKLCPPGKNNKAHSDFRHTLL